MSDYSAPKGTFDILPSEKEVWRQSHLWQYIESSMREVARVYGFKEIRTPMFERTELFIRGVGETSDIVSKEMYTFLDKGERSMTLRPEGTAPAMRSFIENNLAQTPGLHKYYYISPMFRYERPQAGRYRQHHQFGAEAIGIGKPEQDVEMIDLLCELYRRLGIKNVTVMINSVGDEESRIAYKRALTAFLQPHIKNLSEESQVRFTKNILRILDSKDPSDQKILENAPSILDFLNTECRDHFEKVKSLLSSLNLRFAINPKLVRGLDYYNKTVFEIVSQELGAHNTIGAGGRYDGLLSQMGGPALPSVGFGTGIERLIQTLIGQNAPLPESRGPLVFFVPLGEKAIDLCFKMAADLRHNNIATDIDYSGKKIQHGLSLASEEKAVFAAVMGDKEIEEGAIELKNLSTRHSEKVSLFNLTTHLKNHV